MKIVAKEKCRLCGNLAEFKIKDEATLLREAGCSECGVSLRTADVAKVLLAVVGGAARYDTLQSCAAARPDLQVLNMFSDGKIHEAFKGQPGYHFGEFFDGVKSGDFYEGVQCIDLQSIPFPSDYFDIMVTEDVLEHVADPAAALCEISRVLKPGGTHVFTVPVHEKYATVSRKGNPRRVYHGDPLREQGALVCTDFGNDIAELLMGYGLVTREFVGHRFFSPEEISYIDEEYEHYAAHEDDLSQAFRYNSLVYAARKGSAGSSAVATGNVFQRLLRWFK